MDGGCGFEAVMEIWVCGCSGGMAVGMGDGWDDVVNGLGQ